MSRKILVLILTCFFIIIIGFTIYLLYLHYQNSEPEIISTYNDPIVPEGFKSVDTETAKWTKQDDGTIKDWNKGLVIEDSIGNQFVWIPVNLDMVTYNSEKVDIDFQYIKDSLTLSNEEDKQILKYGGFYISRYEAGVPKELQSNLENISEETNNISGIPVSQKGIIPWNYISLKNAKQNAENMYQSREVKSSLPTLKQWEYIIAWLASCGYDVYENSSNFGNYSNVSFEFTGYYSEDEGNNYQYANNKMKTGNMILSTGATERNKTNNIYDIAGNLWCYTNDFLSIGEDGILGYYCVGGHFGHAGNWFPAYSYNLKNVSPLEKVGFRITLFLK